MQTCQAGRKKGEREKVRGKRGKEKGKRLEAEGKRLKTNKYRGHGDVLLLSFWPCY